MIEKQLPYKYKVYEIIKEDILSGKYRAGEELNERELAETMGVSRTPVREAIQMLEHNGWVSIETYKGAVIRSFGRKYLADLMKVRTALELSAVEDAAKNITDETFAAIEQTYQQQVAAMDSSNNLDFAQLDRLFHQSIYELSGNNTLIDLLGNLNDMIFVTATKALSGAPRRQATIREHAAILEALRCRNADQAVRAMKLHMEQTHCNVQHNTSID